MSTEKPRVMVTVSEEMKQQIDEYRFSRHIGTQSQALNELIDLGLKALNPQPDSDKKEEPVTTDGLTDDEIEFLNTFSGLTPSNQRLLLGIAALIVREQGTPPD